MNNSKEPVIILGFGRSGTTWISDIVSKSLGGMILFEPLHPEVCPLSKEFCYHTNDKPSLTQEIEKHINLCLGKQISNKWLLRNHISVNLEDASSKFVEDIWTNCEIIGLKSIRANFMIPWVYRNISKRIVFVKRHPCAVIASLVRRKRFWEEYGFDFHIKKFFEEVVFNEKYTFLDKSLLTDIFNDLNDDYEKMMFLWTISHIIVEKDAENLNIPIFSYEEFYLKPYENSKRLLEYLGHEKPKIHPSYIFTPSMLTLKTHHEFSDSESFVESKDISVFWKDTLSKSQVERINSLNSQLRQTVLISQLND